MVSDPHSLFAMASLVPGLGEVAAMMDMALYLAEGDFSNAATAGLQFLPGGALLVLGAGVVGARHLVTLARAAHGAEGGIKAALEGTRVVRSLEKAGGAVKSAISAAGRNIKRWIRGGDETISKGRALQQKGANGEKVWKSRQKLASNERWLEQRTIYDANGRKLIDSTDNMGRRLDFVKIRDTGSGWQAVEAYETSTQAELRTAAKARQILRGDRLMSTPGAKIKGPEGKGWIDLSGLPPTIRAPWD